MRSLRRRVEALGVPTYLVWLKQFELGGTADLIEFEAYLFEALPTPASMQLTIQQAVWEMEEFGPAE